MSQYATDLAAIRAAVCQAGDRVPLLLAISAVLAEVSLPLLIAEEQRKARQALDENHLQAAEEHSPEEVPR